MRIVVAQRAYASENEAERVTITSRGGSWEVSAWSPYDDELDHAVEPTREKALQTARLMAGDWGIE